MLGGKLYNQFFLPFDASSVAVEPSVATMFNQGDAAGTKIKKAAVIHCCFFYNPTIVLFLLCSICSSLWLLCSRAIFYIYHFNFK